MTTTSTLPAGIVALPAGITPEDIQAHMDAGLTAKLAYAVAWRDANLGTNAEGGASMEAVFGEPVKPGGFGNSVTTGLRKLGREGEVTTTVRATGPKVPSFAEHVANYRRTMEAKRNALIKAAQDAQDALTNVDTDAIVTTELARLDKIIGEAQALKKAITKDPSPLVDAHTERLRHAADSLANARDEGLATIEAELAEAGVTT